MTSGRTCGKPRVVQHDREPGKAGDGPWAFGPVPCSLREPRPPRRWGATRAQRVPAFQAQLGRDPFLLCRWLSILFALVELNFRQCVVRTVRRLLSLAVKLVATSPSNMRDSRVYGYGYCSSIFAVWPLWCGGVHGMLRPRDTMTILKKPRCQ